MAKGYRRQEYIYYNAEEYDALLEAYKNGQGYRNIGEFQKAMIFEGIEATTEKTDNPALQRLLYVLRAEARDSGLLRLAALAVQGDSVAEDLLIEGCKEYGLEPDLYTSSVAATAGINIPLSGTEVTRCQLWVVSILSNVEDGLMASSDLASLAKRAGFSLSVLAKAKKGANVRCVKQGRAWYSMLPEVVHTGVQ